MHIKRKRGPTRWRTRGKIRLSGKVRKNTQINCQRMNRRHQRNWTGHDNSLAAGVRRRHLHLAALFCHMAAALFFGLCHLGIWQKARHRGPADDPQQEDNNTDFGHEIQEANKTAKPTLPI